MASGSQASSWNWLRELKRRWGWRPARRHRPPASPLRLEALEVRLAPAVDFGDAPLPYPVLDSEIGAQHEITSLTLGATITGELDGTHSGTASSDGGDDGVTFGAIQVGALGATVTVNVQGADGKLDAWIDFNGDGSWGGPGEQIFASRNVAIGDNVLTFDVPSFALAGTTYARFRLSTAGDLGIGGFAADGEVEDYQVTIASPPVSSGVFGSQNTISTAANSAQSLFAADVDGDGNMDALSASFSDDTIAWYENDGSGNFTLHNITTTANGAQSVFAADVDGDGDTDVLSASFYDNTVAWYENDGSENFTEHTITTAANGAYSVFAADVDGDGDLDVLSASFYDDRLAWYENDGSENFTEYTITSAANGAKNVFAADVDGDGDLDVLSASRNDDTIAWYENDGSQNFTAHTITTAADGAQSVFAVDVDGDGDTDVLSASANDDTIAWYENDGSENFTAHIISAAADSARSVFAADLDGDGDIDVLSASASDDKIAWYENDGSQNFTTHIISTAAFGTRGVFAADVDGDGDLDALSASNDDDRIAWYENLGNLYINEILVDPAGTDAPNEYVELRGPAGQSLDGVFLMFLEGDSGSTLGEINTSGTGNLIDLSGFSIGSNGFLVIVDASGASSHPYSIAPGTTVVSIDGLDIENASWTALLIHHNGLGADPIGGQDLDTGDDGLDPLPTGWSILDGISVLDGGASDRGYAEIVFSSNGNGLTESGATFVDTGFGGGKAIEHVMRIGDSTGSTTADWVAFQYAGTPPDQTVAQTSDSHYDVGAVIANHLGAANPTSAAIVGDYGDAPTPYPTTFAEDGARHLATGLTLGTDRDEEVDGTPSVAADFDDLNGTTPDDEDGVTFGTIQVGVLGATVTVNVQGAAGKLDAWIDFNGDGSWGGPGEQIFDSRDVTVGDNVLTFDVPSYALAGTTYARFRLSTAGDLGVGGLAADGEVEDYQVTIVSPSPSSGVFGGQNTISTTADGAQTVFAADVDGDGDMDALSASFTDDTIAWYENNGSANFTKHIITAAANGAQSVFAVDVDGDGDTDVLSASFYDDTIAWYENDGSQNFTLRIISTDADGALSVYAADVDGD
ncbi:MAG: FG-GAP repeat domain-containing protein, partial [Gemmataceae bacterium]